jgi:hypothetical protein
MHRSTSRQQQDFVAEVQGAAINSIQPSLATARAKAPNADVVEYAPNEAGQDSEVHIECNHSRKV